MDKIDLGQVFTPRVIADYMVKLFTVSNDSRVLDPCFGEGVFINSMIDNTNYIIDGIELDKRLFNKTIENKSDRCKLYNLNFLEYEPKEKYDGIIMNPPYIRQEKINDLKIYGITKDILRKQNVFSELSSTSNLYMYFIVKALEILKKSGELIVIFPSTWIKAENSKAFKEVIFNNSSIVKKIFIKGDVFGKDVLVDVVILKIIKGVKNRKCKVETIGYCSGEIYKLSEEDIILNDKEHIKLDQYADIRRGLTTGNNKLFINDVFKDIEFTPYVEKIISSPKSIKGFSTEVADTDQLLIIKGEFKYLPNKVSEYLLAWEKEIVRSRKPKTLANKIEKGAEWYKIKTFDSKGIIFSYIIRETMKFIMNSSDYNIRDNFYIVKPKIDNHLLFGLLNNYYTYSRLEDMGKQYGGGLLKLQKYDLDNLKILNIELLSSDDIDKIKTISTELIKSGDEKFIYDISRIISKYESITIDDILKKYNIQRENRLMKGGRK